MYDLLGVAPDASPAAIRDAFRRAARAHHPDRHGPAASNRMADVNHAWRVLGDADQRRAYDLSLREPVGATATSGRTSPAEPVVDARALIHEPARFPWWLMGVLAVIVASFVVLGVATTADPKPPAVDNVLTPGDCVVIQANGDAAERLCSEPHDAVVELLVTEGETCPGAGEPHRDQQGMGTACVRRT